MTTRSRAILFWALSAVMLLSVSARGTGKVLYAISEWWTDGGVRYLLFSALLVVLGVIEMVLPVIVAVVSALHLADAGVLPWLCADCHRVRRPVTPRRVTIVEPPSEVAMHAYQMFNLPPQPKVTPGRRRLCDACHAEHLLGYTEHEEALWRGWR